MIRMLINDVPAGQRVAETVVGNQTQVQHIEASLGQLRRRSFLWGAIKVGLVACSVGSVLLLLAAGSGWLALTHSGLVALFWLLLLLLPSAFLVRLVRGSLRPFFTIRTTARYLDRQIPSLQNLTLSALELAPTSDPGVSRRLVDETLQLAAQRVGRVSMATLVPVKDLRPYGLSALITMLPLVLLYFGGKDRFWESLEIFFQAPLADVLPVLTEAELEVRDATLGDISLTLIYPAYLHRETDRLDNSSGEVVAPAGTQVTLEARTSIPVNEAGLFVNEVPTGVVTVAQQNRLSVEFLVEKEGSYRLELLPLQGEKLETRPFPIRVQLDEVPLVEVSGLEASQEIDISVPIKFSFSARDDHGVSKVDLVIEGPSGPARRNLSTVELATEEEEGEVTWYPAEWNLPQSGSVDLYIEAYDNDTVSGPNVGRSARYKMVIADEDRKRQQALAAREALKEALLGTLGDSLLYHDEPVRKKTPAIYEREMMELSQSMRKVFEAFRSLHALLSQSDGANTVVDKVILELEEEITESFETVMDGYKDQTQALTRPSRSSSAEMLAANQAAFIETLESGILSMETFANLKRMESALAKGEEMREMGEDLRKQIEDAIKAGKAPDMQELLAKLQAMEQKMAEMGQQLSQMEQASADWFQNSAADESAKVESALEEVKKLLEQGKTEEALAKLEQYLEATTDLMDALKNMARDELGDNPEALSKDVSGAIEGIKELEQQQRRLLNDTQATKESLAKEAGVDASAMDTFVQKALQKVETMRQEIRQAKEGATKSPTSPIDITGNLQDSEHKLDMLEAALRAKDLNDASRTARDTVRDLQLSERGLEQIQRDLGIPLGETIRHQQAARKSGEALARDLDDLQRRMDQMREAAAQQGEGIASRQRSLQQKGQELSERLGEYSKDSPFIPAKWGERVQNATQSMQSASQKLQNGEMVGGSSDQDAALKELSELRNEMEQTKKQMQQGQAMAQGQQPSGQKPQGKGGGGQTEENWGDRGHASRKVDISKEYAAPEAYRREIMEGMKGEAPDRYKRLNREYYEKLVR